MGEDMDHQVVHGRSTVVIREYPEIRAAIILKSNLHVLFFFQANLKQKSGPGPIYPARSFLIPVTSSSNLGVPVST